MNKLWWIVEAQPVANIWSQSNWIRADTKLLPGKAMLSELFLTAKNPSSCCAYISLDEKKRSRWKNVLTKCSCHRNGDNSSRSSSFIKQQYLASSIQFVCIAYKHKNRVAMHMSFTDGFDIDESHGCNNQWSIFFEMWNLLDDNSFDNNNTA